MDFKAASLNLASVGMLPEPPSDDLTRSCATEQNPIAAVLVFSDPSNWYIDLQLMYDLYTSGHFLPPLPANSLYNTSIRINSFHMLIVAICWL